VFGELVVKQLYKTATATELRSAQTGYEPIVIEGADDVYVWGVVTGTVRQFARV
jgi:SOS-response transcriptional repressor LexA